MNTNTRYSNSTWFTITSVLIMTCLANNLWADIKSPGQFAIGVSPFLQPTERQAAHREVLLLVLEKAKPGDHIDVVNAFHNQPIAHFEIPVGKQFEKNARARTVRLAEELLKLGAFFAMNTPPAAPELAGAIRLPQFLEFMATHLRTDTQPMAVIALGSPFYADGQEKSFNMYGAQFPGDPLFLAGRKRSPFSTVEKRNALAGVSLHWAFFRECFTNDLHFSRVQRTWALFAHLQNGSLVSFAAAPSVVFARAALGETKPLAFDPINPNDKRPRMLRVNGDRIIDVDDENFADGKGESVPPAPLPPAPLKSVSLPPGSRAEIVRVLTNNAPFLIVDVAVEDAQNEPVRGLITNDFRFIVDGETADVIRLANARNEAPPIHLIIAMDGSSSIAGEPLDSAKAAASQFVRTIGPERQVFIQVLSFNDDVACIQEWTTDRDAVVEGIQRLQPNGKTALCDAIEAATRNLATRQGERRLVLFTDGRDTCSKSTATPERLAEQLRRAEIQSFAIGLRSQELDANTLSALANRYAEADIPQALGAAFTSARQHLAREVYRFILLPRSTVSGPGAIQVTVGDPHPPIRSAAK